MDQFFLQQVFDVMLRAGVQHEVASFFQALVTDAKQLSVFLHGVYFPEICADELAESLSYAMYVADMRQGRVEVCFEHGS